MRYRNRSSVLTRVYFWIALFGLALLFIFQAIIFPMGREQLMLISVSVSAFTLVFLLFGMTGLFMPDRRLLPSGRLPVRLAEAAFLAGAILALVSLTLLFLDTALLRLWVAEYVALVFVAIFPLVLFLDWSLARESGSDRPST